MSAAADAFMASVRAMAAEPASPGLDANAVYLSPSGRRCRLYGFSNGSTWATMLYDLQDGSPARSFYSDGFTLARHNWHLLRRVA
jgi:hypothetical protein